MLRFTFPLPRTLVFWGRRADDRSRGHPQARALEREQKGREAQHLHLLFVLSVSTIPVMSYHHPHIAHERQPKLAKEVGDGARLWAHICVGSTTPDSSHRVLPLESQRTRTHAKPAQFQKCQETILFLANPHPSLAWGFRKCC